MFSDFDLCTEFVVHYLPVPSPWSQNLVQKVFSLFNKYKQETLLFQVNNNFKLTIKF